MIIHFGLMGNIYNFVEDYIINSSVIFIKVKQRLEGRRIKVL